MNNGILDPNAAQPSPLSGRLSMWDLLRQYVADAMPGGALNPEVTPQGVLDGVALATSPVPVLGDVAGLAADAYRMLDPEERTPMNMGLAALGLLPFVPSAGASRGIIPHINQGSRASKSPNIYDPKPQPQRAFGDDYPDPASARPDGSGRVTVDVDGRPIASTAVVAGRRVLGGSDEGIGAGGAGDLATSLGAQFFPATRSGPDLKGSFGRYRRHYDPEGNTLHSIFFDKAQPRDKAGRILAHEVAHMIDDKVYGLVSPMGSKIPTDGLSKELHRLYADLNGGIRSPKSIGYGTRDYDAELMAEAIRAYLVDPNYIKSVAPKTAARIREHVNANPNLNRVIHFNSVLAPGLGLGLLAPRQDDSNAPAR